MWEWVTESGRSLYRWECELSNIVWFIESKNAFYLVVINMLLDTKYIRVQMLDVLNVRENESFLWIKTKSNDILNIVDAHLNCTFGSIKFALRSVDVFFIISDLNDKRYIECIL